ncbi:MAG: lytic murein transglycosylase [Cellvibrionaceae bacterium]
MADARKKIPLIFRPLAAFIVILSSGMVFSETVIEKPKKDQTSNQLMDFPACIQGLQNEARSRGVSEELIKVLGQVTRIERTISLDRSQPEFVQTFADYFTKRVTDYRVTRGRDLLKENKEFLQGLTKEYGVPAQYIVSFWGLESNFGSYIGKMPILDSLATLACDTRRSGLFTRELFSALDIMAEHTISVEQMQGSWAGAIGHTQFLPSAYKQYGVDGDGDGRIDLWSSQVDALTSAANYLNKLGWKKELRWGREVVLPSGFDYSLSGIKNPKKLSEWRQLKIKKASGELVADLDIEAALLVPSGSDGPKFLIYDNFEVIMKWNRSQFYALSVGSLADRINGAGEFSKSFPNTDPLTKDQVIQLQTRLDQMGFEPGDVDGRLGPATTQSISKYQKSINAVADGFADSQLLKSLNIL